MRTTIDAAGRVVIPKSLRDQVGLRSGEVEVVADGTGVHVEPVADDSIDEEGGRLVIPPTGAALDHATVQALRNAGQG